MKQQQQRKFIFYKSKLLIGIFNLKCHEIISWLFSVLCCCFSKHIKWKFLYIKSRKLNKFQILLLKIYIILSWGCVKIGKKREIESWWWWQMTSARTNNLIFGLNVKMELKQKSLFFTLSRNFSSPFKNKNK